MTATTRLAVLVAGTLLSACVSVPPTPSNSLPPASATPNPVIGATWIPDEFEPAPGNTVTAAIALAVDGPDEEVVAAVFGLRHPAGNQATVWVFRAGNLPSDEAIRRWATSQAECDAVPEHGSLADRETAKIWRLFFDDQCQPQYLVQLDDRTVAVITDHGAGARDASGQPMLPYRPSADIEWIVRWLEDRLTKVDLVPGGPPLRQG